MPALNRIRLLCTDADRASLHVKSNLDSTYRLEHKTDEDLCFTDDDLVAIQNKRADHCRITLEVIRLPEGRRAVLRPSRQAHRVLLDPEVSSIRARTHLVLGGGETLMLHSSEWKGKIGGGACFPV